MMLFTNVLRQSADAFKLFLMRLSIQLPETNDWTGFYFWAVRFKGG